MVITYSTVDEAISMKSLKTLMESGNCSIEKTDDGIIVETGRRIEDIMGQLYFSGNVKRTLYKGGIIQ